MSVALRMDIERILFETLRPSLGCTEIAAVAFATASAVQAAARWSPGLSKISLTRAELDSINYIHVRVDRNTYKNAFSVYIPNTEGHKGMAMAAALGLFCDPEKTAGIVPLSPAERRTCSAAIDCQR